MGEKMGEKKCNRKNKIYEFCNRYLFLDGSRKSHSVNGARKMGEARAALDTHNARNLNEFENGLFLNFNDKSSHDHKAQSKFHPS